MSAIRILNPLNDIHYRMLGSSSKRSANTFSPLATSASLSSPSRLGLCNKYHNDSSANPLNRIKRDLFGSTDSKETERIYKSELEKNNKKACQKWGFDFRTGSPLSSVNGNYVWERVNDEESLFVPEMYTLTRNAHTHPSTETFTSLDLLLDERSERENVMLPESVNNEPTEFSDEATDGTSLIVYKLPTIPSKSTPAGKSAVNTSSVQRATCSSVILKKTKNSISTCKRQPKITEFMKERKRSMKMPSKGILVKRSRLTINNSLFTSGKRFLEEEEESAISVKIAAEVMDQQLSLPNNFVIRKRPRYI